MPFSFPESVYISVLCRKTETHFSGRSSDFWINQIIAPSHPNFKQWHYAIIVPSYSGGPVPDLHRIPFSSAQSGHLKKFTPPYKE